MEREAAAADERYVLGDLFEYWVGDDDLQDPFNAIVAGFFRRFSNAGRKLYLLHGNRDFLVGERFARETGARLLEDPALVGDTLLMHGDTLCTDDLDYQNWRKTARSAEWQRDFLSKSLADRHEAILGMREKSKEVIAAKPADIMDVNAGAVKDAFRKHRVRRLIHGHTHRPARHDLEVDGAKCERWVLPDWYGPGGYLALDDVGARLVSF